MNSPIFPSFRVRLFVAVPLGNCNHLYVPTRSYWKASPVEELAWARSTVIRTWVSTRDLVPPSGMLGIMIGRLGYGSDMHEEAIRETHL